MGRRGWLDKSPSSMLAVCSCGWREAATSAAGGWAKIAEHMAIWHGDATAQHIARRNVCRK
jgi:hypothetical protein